MEQYLVQASPIKYLSAFCAHRKVLLFFGRELVRVRVISDIELVPTGQVQLRTSISSKQETHALPMQEVIALLDDRPCPPEHHSTGKH
jgi:hypothetical protein